MSCDYVVSILWVSLGRWSPSRCRAVLIHRIYFYTMCRFALCGAHANLFLFINVRVLHPHFSLVWTCDLKKLTKYRRDSTFWAMLASQRLGLILARCMRILPREGPLGSKDVLEPKGGPATVPYFNSSYTNDQLVDLLVSVSELSMGSNEEWLRLKKACLARLSEFSTDDVVKILVILVKNDACGLVECSQIQDQLASPRFVTDVAIQECIETIFSIVLSGSRLSPKFCIYAQKVFKSLISVAQVDILPKLSYAVGYLLVSRDNNIPVEVRHSLLKSLLERITSENYSALSQDDLIYMIWCLSTFCSDVRVVQPVYIEACEAILARGIRLEHIKDISARSAMLLLCSLCSLFSLSGNKCSTLQAQENGLVVRIIDTNQIEVGMLSREFLRRLVECLNLIVFRLVRCVTNGEIQNRSIMLTALDMLTFCGLSKILKNAQILHHLLLRGLLFGVGNAWFRPMNTFSDFFGLKTEQPLINFYFLMDDVIFFDRLTFYLGPCISSPLNGHDKTSAKEVMSVLEALVYGNFSTHFKDFYARECIKLVPRALCVSSPNEFTRIVEVVTKLSIDSDAVWYAIRERSSELKGKWDCAQHLRNDIFGRCMSEKFPRVTVCCGELTSLIHKEGCKLVRNENINVKQLANLLETVDKRKGSCGVTAEQCMAVVKSLSGLGVTSKEAGLCEPALTSIFLRIDSGQSFDMMLRTILDCSSAGVSRGVLLSALSCVGSRLVERGVQGIEFSSSVLYLIAGYELGAGCHVLHPHIIHALYNQEKLMDVPFDLLGRLFAALCDFGVDDKFLLEHSISALDLCHTRLSDEREWDDSNRKAALALIRSMWSSASKVVWSQLFPLARGLVDLMVKRVDNQKSKTFLLHVVAAIATLVICGPDDISAQRKLELLGENITNFFFENVVLLFSEGGLIFSLRSAESLLVSEVGISILPRCGNVTCSLIVSYALQCLTQANDATAKRLTPYAVGLWRCCLRHVEKSLITDRTLIDTVSLCVRFGASSQSFDRLMIYLMEEDCTINMLTVSSLAGGLIRTAKRRSVATQFIAHYSQRLPMDHLPATALMALIVYFSRDAEKVALGLHRVNMLLSLVWASLSLKIDRLPSDKALWKLVESVPMDSASHLIQVICDVGIIDDTPASELVRPLSLILGWKSVLVSRTIVMLLLGKIESCLETRQCSGSTESMTVEEIQKAIRGYEN
uniref:WGS project CAEQ00000000 data, annotated contig 1708 n=1 Tax=Trypanosoma congolense (strain IL3000) TaxID=1068625 RepID=F9W858_TRYCI|nr:unnamed protein product [Trypanosoma congolense IL3000]